MPNLISQDLLVQKSVMKDMRFMLRSNTPNDGIDCIVSQKFGFFTLPKTNKTTQQELIQIFRAHPTLIKNTKQSIL